MNPLEHESVIAKMRELSDHTEVVMHNLVAIVNAFGPIAGQTFAELGTICKLTRELCEEIEKAGQTGRS